VKVESGHDKTAGVRGAELSAKRGQPAFGVTDLDQKIRVTLPPLGAICFQRVELSLHLDAAAKIDVSAGAGTTVTTQRSRTHP
jgi:hypothetical protein